MARTSAGDPTLYAVGAARSMLISTSAQLLPTASIAKAFSKQCPKFMEEQAILRYKAEHGGTFQQARAAVIVDTPRAVSSRTYAQATKLSLKSSKATQPKASDKVTAPVTSKENAQRHTPPSSPKGALSRPAEKPRARKPSKEGAPRDPLSRFGNVSDMDIECISDYLSDERKSRSRNTRNKYYTTTDVHTLFREVHSSKITEYLKEIKLFDKI